jgi:hypothetical protein
MYFIYLFIYLQTTRWRPVQPKLVVAEWNSTVDYDKTISILLILIDFIKIKLTSLLLSTAPVPRQKTMTADGKVCRSAPLNIMATEIGDDRRETREDVCNLRLLIS